MALGSTITQITDSGLKPGITFPNFVSTGIATATNFKTGTSNVHSTGIEVAGINVNGGDVNIGSGATVYDDGSIRASGIVTATEFYGGGGNLTGIDATAVQTGTTKVQTESKQVVTKISNVGIVSVTDAGMNVTGVSTANTFKGNLTGNVTGNVTGTASQLATDATGANLTLSGNLGVAGTITYEDVARVDATGISTFREGFGVGPLAGIALTAYKDGSIRTSGIVTAASFSGSGANLTGIDASSIKFGSDVKVQANNSGAVVTGILTINQDNDRTTFMTGNSVGVGTTNTAGRNAGVGTAVGTLTFNTDINALNIYSAEDTWLVAGGVPPVWQTAAGSLGSLYDSGRAASNLTTSTVSATGGTVSYSVVAGSLPAGLSLNATTGAITGTANQVGSDTTSTFTIKADNGASANREFSILVKTIITQTYSYTGSTVTWSRPTGVTSVWFEMWGAGGSQGTCTSNGAYSGGGGKTKGTINISAHATLYLQVAQSGQNVSGNSAGGWPTGGEGNDEHSCKGGGGGGSSQIYNSSGTGSYTNLIAVAGGGGGASHGNPNSVGGDGGGTNGNSSNRGGQGGSQNGGGNPAGPACGNNSNAGSRLQGGNAGTGGGCTNSGSGGGGGWYGGGAGGNSNSGNSYGGGGGGSGYFNSTLVPAGSTVQYNGTGWGSNKPSGVADRGDGSTDNQEGGNGYIMLQY